MMCKPSTRCTTSLIIFLALSGWTSAQEWTRFRGPDGTGIGKDASIPASFSEADYLWKVKLSGPGHSSPVLWGNRVFLTCAHDVRQEREVLCLDARSGQTLWTVKLPFTPYRHNRLNSFAASTPAVDAERVYVSWISGGRFVAMAFDHLGNRLWQREMGQFRAKHGAGASPIALNGLMIVGNDNIESGFLAALDGKTGETVWHIDRIGRSTSYITPTVYRPAGGDPELIFVSEANGITAVNPISGKKNWELNNLFTLKSVASPVVAGNLIFATAGRGGGGEESAAVHPADSQGRRKPKVVWQGNGDLPYVPTPIAIGEHLYILSDGGVMTCVVADTGKRVWRENLGAKFYASPVSVNGRIYAVTRGAEVIAVNAGPDFEILGKSKLPEKSDATPAIANGKMYIRTLNHLICIGDTKAG